MSGNIEISIPQAWVLGLIGIIMTGTAVLPRYIGGTLEARVYKLELKMDKHEAEAMISFLDANGQLSVAEKRLLRLEESRMEAAAKALQEFR